MLLISDKEPTEHDAAVRVICC